MGYKDQFFLKKYEGVLFYWFVCKQKEIFWKFLKIGTEPDRKTYSKWYEY